MGLLTGGLNGRRFRVDARLPDGFRDLFLEQVRANAFADDDTAADGEPRIGWVSVFDPSMASFELNDLLIDRYLSLTLRVDTKKVQGQYQKIAIARRLAEVCAERGVDKLAKSEQEVVIEALEADLLRRALPSVATTDLAWDIHTGDVVVFSTSEATLELVRQLMKETFGVVLRPELTVDWLTEHLTMEEITDRLVATLSGGASEGEDPLAAHHLALGSDFLIWLWLQSESSDGRFRIIEGGPSRRAVVEEAAPPVDPADYETAPTVVNEVVEDDGEDDEDDEDEGDVEDDEDDDEDEEDEDPGEDEEDEDPGEDEEELTEAMRHADLTLWIDSRLKLRELHDETPSTTILLGLAPSTTPEARQNLHVGKRPVEALLGLKLNDLECSMTLRATADGVDLTGIKIPFAVKTGRDEKVLERMVLLDLVHGTVKRLFHQFFLARTSPSWHERVERWMAEDVAAK